MDSISEDELARKLKILVGVEVFEQNDDQFVLHRYGRMMTSIFDGHMPPAYPDKE